MSTTIADAVREASAWAGLPGVVAVGQGRRNGEDCIEVLVSDPDAARRIPPRFQGYPVHVEHSGPIQAQ